MDYPSSAYATHGKALKRISKQGSKEKLQNYYKTTKPLKKQLTSDIIKSKEGWRNTMKEYVRKPRLSKDTIRKLMNGETVTKGIYEYSVDQEWNEKLNRFDEALLRWNNAINDYECWILGWNGLYEFEVDKND